MVNAHSGVAYFTQYVVLSLSELLQHGENGFVFVNDRDLGMIIMDWFDGFPNNKLQMNTNQRLKGNLAKFRQKRWQQNWDEVAMPMFQ